jgi:hypothetical protein
MDERVTDEDDKVEPSSSILPSDILTSIYDITRAIFRHLPIHSVDSYSLVCQSWAHMSRVTKSQRHTIHALTYPSNPSLPTTICSNLLHDFDQFISAHIHNNLWSIPTLAFVVSTNILASKGFYSSPNSPLTTKHLRTTLRSETASVTRRTERFDIPQALTRHLNKSCKILMIAADGIIASSDDNQSNEIESSKRRNFIYSKLNHYFR